MLLLRFTLIQTETELHKPEQSLWFVLKDKNILPKCTIGRLVAVELHYIVMLLQTLSGSL